MATVTDVGRLGRIAVTLDPHSVAFGGEPSM
jgi:hypothetical protein